MLLEYLYTHIKGIDGATIGAAFMAASILFLMAGNKLKLPGGIELKGQAESILNRTGTTLGNEINRTMVQKKITQADLSIQPEYFIGLQYGLPVVCLVILLPPALLGWLDIYWIVLPAIVAYLLPGMWLNKKARERVETIKREIPDFCILLGNAVKGADLMLALQEVAGTMKGELAKEIDRALMDMATGDNRMAALNKMTNRCGIPELTGLVGKMQQAMRYGSPLEPVIKHYAEKVMSRKKYEAQKTAGELTIKLLFPIIIFVLLPLGIMMGFPIVWNMLTVFGS